MATAGHFSPSETPMTDTVIKTEVFNSIDIGAQFDRWIELKNNLQCDNEAVARLLLDVWYDINDEDPSIRFDARGGSKMRMISTPDSTRRRNCIVYLDSIRPVSDVDKSESEELEWFNQNGKTTQSRRKPPKCQVSRYLADGDEVCETKVEEHDDASLSWEHPGSRDPLYTYRVTDRLDESDGNSYDDGNDENYDDKENILSDVESLEKVDSDLESEGAMFKTKKDSDSDWIPNEDELHRPRRKSRRISNKNVGKKRVDTSEDDSDNCDLSDEYVEKEDSINSLERTRSSSLRPTLVKKFGVSHCSACDVQLSKDEADAHLYTHYTIPCDMCDKLFYSQASVEAHKVRKHYSSSYMCNYCMFSTKNSLKLKRHISKQHKKQSMSVSVATLCHICGEQFRYVNQVQRHLGIVHDIKEASTATYICDQCGNEYFMRPSLRKHMLTHQEKTIMCKFEGCDSKFSLDCQYKRHFNVVHLKIKNHPCPHDNCGMKFAFRRTLLNHVNMVHLKVRLFPCTWSGCDRSFYAKKHLTVHLRIHNDEKPFSCSQCDYTCRQRAALNWHLKKHGIKPDHPESVENEIKNQKSGFPVNFKRGRKRTRHKKSRGIGYSNDEIESMNQKYHEIVKDSHKMFKEIGGNATGGIASENTKDDFDDSVQNEYNGSVKDVAIKPTVDNYTEREKQLSLSPGITPNQYTSPLSKHTEADVMHSSPTNAYPVKTLLQDDHLHTPAAANYQFPSHQQSGFLPNRELNFTHSFPIVSQNMYATHEKSGIYPSSLTDYSHLQDIRMDYQGFPMKENMHSSTIYPPASPYNKESFLGGQRVADMNFAHHLPKADILRRVPQGYQVPLQYDSQTLVSPAMGVGSGMYVRDMIPYSREYK